MPLQWKDLMPVCVGSHGLRLATDAGDENGGGADGGYDDGDRYGIAGVFS